MTAVKNGAVTHMTVALHDAVLAGKAVHDAVVLQVRAVLDDDASEIAAQRGAGTDIAISTDNHVSDQTRGRMDEASLPDHRPDRLVGEAGHGQVTAP
jgi:hypothetical protein